MPGPSTPNERMLEILGAETADVIGQHSFDFVYPEDVPAAEQLFASKVRGNADPFRFQLRRKDGSGIWVDVQGTPMYNAAGQFTGIVGTFAPLPPGECPESKV
jgi:PAS domain S-box-containing protein